MEQDPVLRRLEREALVACGAMVVVALGVRRGNPDAALGVLAGGLLSAVSYGAIKGVIDTVIARSLGGRRLRWRWALVKFFTRHGILALAAYVMLARLRVHAVGVVAGASSLVVAATWEAIRRVHPASRVDHPRGIEKISP